ncbi:MAG: hypothetical protein J1F64_07275 [Oscillospiraceae bacterium]|nr:hypothetical protein [Oscillospiraceae bacterium]
MKNGMLKLLSAVCMSVCALFSITLAASAQNGDIIGNVYSTDILAYVNGKPIVSYNIGGKTAVAAEDLNGFSGGADNNAWYGYGFDGWYNDDTRTFTVNFHGEPYGDPAVERGAPGTVAGNIYETDIQVIFNGRLVPSYNIDGKTAICTEDLGTVTENSPNAEYGYSEYMCKFTWDPQTRSVFLDTWQPSDPRSVPLHKLAFELDDDVLTASYDQLNYYGNTLSVNIGEDFGRDTYRIKPFYTDGCEVGTLWIDSSGFPNINADLEKLYGLLKDRCVILGYDEAVNYITTGYTVTDRRDTGNASIFLAEKNGAKYLFYAMKKGDIILEWEDAANNYDIAEITDREDGLYLHVYPFGGPHGPTDMYQPIIPEAYE